MANLQESSKAPSKGHSNMHRLIMIRLIEALLNPKKRDHALYILYKKMGHFRENLAPLLWNSFRSVSILLLEITSVYKFLSTPNLTPRISMRASLAVGLFKCIASHPATRMLFLKARCLSYIEPFMETKIQDNQPHEILRATSLGVIASLVTYGDARVVHFLLETKIFPWCITCMDVGNAKSKRMAAYIIHKILKHDAALQHCCCAADRFFTLLGALTSLFKLLVVEPSPLLLKHVILCCLQLTNNTRALDALTSSLPQCIRYRDLSRQIDDPVVMTCLNTLIRKITGRATHQRLMLRNYN